MKKLITLLLAAALLLSLAACGGNDTTSGRNDGNGNTADAANAETSQTTGRETDAPEGASPVEPEALEGEWINLTNWNTMSVGQFTLDSSSNTYEASGSTTSTDHSEGVGGSSFDSYTVDGDIFSTYSGERYRIVLENEKLYLRSEVSDLIYIKREDFYRFEDIEVHNMGDTVSTDAIEFTLNGYDYQDSVSRIDLGVGYDLFFDDGSGNADTVVPDSGQIWGKISYKLFNISNLAIPMFQYENVRFWIVYRDNFTFDTEEHGVDNFIIKGHGGDSHFKCLYLMGEGLELPPLVSEDFDFYMPVPPTVRDDTDSPVHLLVILPASSGVEMFAYNIQ